MVEKSLQQLDLPRLTRRRYTPSPAAWEDQVLYFLMLDRFSDGGEQGYHGNDGEPVVEGSTPPFHPGDEGNAISNEADAARWREAGARWVGGTLKGLTSKIGYLQRLGATAIWVSPVFKQVPFQESYHGYGIQNFLDVDPHFGTRRDLRQMVRTAHRHGIYVILDIILNHSGDVFAYDPDRYWTQDPGSGEWYIDPRWDGRSYAVTGFRDSSGTPDLPFAPLDRRQQRSAWPDGAIWPAELQLPGTFTARGRISNWDHDPEFMEGDFYDLKDIHLGSGTVDSYQPSQALWDLCQVYKFWIAYADVDGFRVDTVKHMDPGATRFFTSVIHEFAQRIGKENFYLIGEITGGRERAFTTLETTGLDAALGIDDIPDRLEYLVKGYRNPQEYFDLFRNSLLVQKESHIWFRNKVVTLFDDHDQVRKGGYKARFCAGSPDYPRLLPNVLALNATTLGIPCIYYGSEQAFDGQGDSDRYIREAMFGGEFGAFRTRGRHFFNEAHPVYRQLAQLLTLRREKIALRRGRQYLCRISGDGQSYGYPVVMGDGMRSVVAWLRLFDDQQVLAALNTDPDRLLSAWVSLEAGYYADGARLTCLYSSDEDQVGQELVVQESAGQKVVQLSLPAAGFV
ncbi:MAG: alpha-amylase family glycosyl hydrolase, partial [Anaerolineales bacterium]